MDNQDKKDFCFVYFIENHISTSSPEISLSEGSEELFGDLKILKSEQFPKNKSQQKGEFIYNLYSFKLYPDKIKEKEKDKVDINLELENEKTKFYNKTVITDFDKDNYIYQVVEDTKFKSW